MGIGSNKPKKIKNLLDDLIEDKGWEEKIEEANIPKLWEEAVGESIAESCKAVSLKDGVLIVETESSTWRSELKFRSESIIKSLNEKIGKNIIKSIKFR